MTRLPDAKTSGVDENPWERHCLTGRHIQGACKLTTSRKGHCEHRVGLGDGGHNGLTLLGSTDREGCGDGSCRAIGGHNDIFNGKAVVERVMGLEVRVAPKEDPSE